LNVIFIESTIGDILKQHKSNKGNVVCSLCAKLKKAIMVKKAKELGINKMATGHHMDDAIETLFLNMLNNGKIATFLPCMYFDRNDIDMIRPLIMCREALLKEEAKKLEIPLIVNSCPNEHSTLRAEIKEILEKQFYRNPKFNKSYINLATSLTNKKQSKL
jgi:tRNA(Ile)-lysidine synthase TilS/MesJ